MSTPRVPRRLAPHRMFVLSLLGYTHALYVNRTIDDEYGDSVTGLKPQYSPPDVWNQGSLCEDCSIKLDSSHVLNGTWHDATQVDGDSVRSITMHFNGTAIYVHNVLANTVVTSPVPHLTSLLFVLDGVQVGTFLHEPTSNTAYDYDVPVYTNESLENMEHMLEIRAVTDPLISSLVLFDYAVYTFIEEEVPSVTGAHPSQTSTISPNASQNSSPNASPHRSAPVGAIVGVVVACLALLALSALLLLRRRQKSLHAAKIEKNPPGSPRMRAQDLTRGNEEITPYPSAVMARSHSRAPVAAKSMSMIVETSRLSSDTETSLLGRADIPVPLVSSERFTAARSQQLNLGSLNSELAALRREMETLRDLTHPETQWGGSEVEVEPLPGYDYVPPCAVHQ